MFNSSVSQKEEQLLSGQYGEILKDYDLNKIDEENLWIVLEAYIGLNMLNEADYLLQRKFLSQSEHKNEFITTFYQAFLLKEKAEFKKTINILTAEIKKEEIKENNILFIKFLLLLTETKIEYGDFEKIDEFFDLIASHIEQLDLKIYKHFLKSEYIHIQGNFMLKLGDYEKALNYYSESLQLRQLNGNPNKMAKSLMTLGEIYSHKGQLLLANDYFRQAIDFWERVGNLDIIALAYLNLGRIQSINGDYNLAMNYFQNGLEFIKQSKNIIILSELVIELIRNRIDLQDEMDFNDLIKLFPHDQLHISVIEGYYEVAKGLIAQHLKNWGIAYASWQKVIINEGIGFEYQLLAHEALAEIAYTDWLTNPSIDELLLLEDRLDTWEMLCMEGKILQLSKIYFMRAKLALSSPNKFEVINLSVAEQQLDRALIYAEEAGIKKEKIKIQIEINYVKRLKNDLSNLLNLEKEKLKQKEEMDFNTYLEKLKEEFKNVQQ